MDLTKLLSSLNDKLCLKSFPNRGGLAGNIILVTGGAGSIGSEIVVQSIARKAALVIVLDSCENSIYKLEQRLEREGGLDRVVLVLGDYGDETLLRQIVEDFPVNILVHAGAYKHVPILQYNVYACINNNVQKALTLFETLRYEVEEVVIVSTDKASSPSNAMGFSKLLVEEMGKLMFGKKCRVVRFGNVLGSSGSVALLFYQQALQGETLTVTDLRMKRYFMSIAQASQLVLNVLYLGGGTYILDMGEQIEIVKLAKAIISLTNSSSHYEETGIRSGEKLQEELCSPLACLEAVDDGIFRVEGEEPLHHRFLDHVKAGVVTPQHFRALAATTLRKFGDSNDRF